MHKWDQFAPRWLNSTGTVKFILIWKTQINSTCINSTGTVKLMLIWKTQIRSDKFWKGKVIKWKQLIGRLLVSYCCCWEEGEMERQRDAQKEKKINDAQNQKISMLQCISINDVNLGIVFPFEISNKCHTHQTLLKTSKDCTFKN